MSYILEALKKSDQERQRGTAPNLQTPQPGGKTARAHRPVWPYLLTGALLINAALLVWWLQPWRANDSQALREQSAAAQSEQADAPAPPNPSGPLSRSSDRGRGTSKAVRSQSHDAQRQSSEARELSHSGAELGPSRALSDDPTEKTARSSKTARSFFDPSLTKDSNGPEILSESRSPVTRKPESAPNRSKANREKDVIQGEQSGKTVASPSFQEKASSSPPASPVSIASANREGSKKGGQQQRPAEKNEAAIAEEVFSEMLSFGASESPKQKTTAPPPSLSSAPSDRKTLSFKELPFSVQQDIPRMTFSVLIYSEKPAERMVNINGRTTREGQEVSDGLKLEEITPDGAIFSFKGYRFQKGVF